jgi:hypothetical protein
MTMVRKLSTLVAASILALTGCGKASPLTGTGAFKIKDSVWATYGWSKGRMTYIIYFVPTASSAFDPEGVAANVKIAKEGDLFEGALDGYKEKSKSPFKAEPKKGEVTIDGRTYRGTSVFLVNFGAAKDKVQPINGIAFGPTPKDPEEWPLHAEAEVKRVLKENPKIAEFPKEPEPVKPDPKKKK